MSAVPRLLPMLAGGSGVPPDVGAYQLEPKFDGQRVMALVEAGGLTLTNRRGGEITTTYPELDGLAGALAGHDAVLDGEVVTFDARGRTSFQHLQRRMHVKLPSVRLVSETPVMFMAFDVIWLDGAPLIGRPQHERRHVLEGLRLEGPRLEGLELRRRAWQIVPLLDGSPDELLEACRQVGLEGYMAKRRDALYQPGRRSSAWWKVKCGRRREFVVGGWSAGQGSRATSIGSLALGCFDVDAAEAERRGRPQQLVYVGQAGSGLTEEMIGQLRRLFDQIETPASPFVDFPAVALRLVRPLLVVEVAYSEVTETGMLRHPSIKGLRTDVVADEVVVDAELAPGVAGRLRR